MKKLLLTLTAMTLSANLAYAETTAPAAKSKEAIREEVKAQREQVKSACSSDVSTTGCTGEGREQLKCIREYKKAHKDFKFSDACKAARKQGQEVRAEFKQMRKDRKAKKEATQEANQETKETK